MNKILIVLGIIFVAIIVMYILRTIFVKPHEYQKVAVVKNLNDLRKHFLLDNPTGNGTDPTGGLVNYAHMFDTDSNGNLKKNINGNTTWQEIPKNPSLLEDYDGGIKIKLADNLENGVVGAPRLISRKLYRGGLFVFDVEHSPYGCSVWPALWLNGFVGGDDQYHEEKGTNLYNESMEKLVKSTISNKFSKEKFSHTCTKDTSLDGKKDPYLSEYTGKDVYVAMWPNGGEFDILEQVNFSDTNLVSIHSGASCEVVNGYDNDYNNNPDQLDKGYTNDKVRSACGVTWWPNPGGDQSIPSNIGMGPYAGCKNKESKIGEFGGATTTLPNGATRYNCPNSAGVGAGNTQVKAPFGSFGEVFNQNGGGVYAVQWTPEDRVNVWWFPRLLYSESLLEENGGPLSENPNPNDWPQMAYPNEKNAPGKKKKEKVLIASYILNNKNAINSGCDFNYQGITLNITVGGGWGGSTMPEFCSVDGKSEWNDYIKKCYNASPKRALNSKSKNVDPDTKCYDGGMTPGKRGALAKPVFFKEAYFKIRQIRVYQKSDTDDNIW